MRLRRPLAASALLLLGMAAVPALAADHEATLASGATRFEWEGAPQLSRGAPLYLEEARTAIPCDSGPARPCEEILLKLAEDGKLTVKVDGLEGTGGTTDVDIYLYASDASGEPGEKLASSAAKGPDTVSVAKAKAGYYLAVADYYHSYNSGYKGLATFQPAVGPLPPPAATPTPTAAPAPKQSSSKAACRRKAKKIKNKKKRKKALKKCARR
jgi:hypothetical protein